MNALECRRVTPELAGPLAELFKALALAGDARHFHPHALDEDEAARVARYRGDDLYYVVTEGSSVLAYAMLRGWDEGYDVPSLGIAVHPEVRTSGLARMFMEFLHASARRRGALRVRLKVYRDNASALRLYRQLGYEFDGEEDGQLVGSLEL